ncbi:MAG: ABC-2 transporter permease [Firmicutes bacterium]|nr:ABC-2 transporter permease [Bacillota bacterium]
MKGLLLKDFYTVKSMWKYILFIAIVFSLSFWGRGDGTLAAMFSFISTILLINSLAQDEMDQWNKIALTMPLTCRQIVISKYIFAMLVCIFGTAGGLLLTLIARLLNMSEFAVQIQIVLLGSAVSSAVILLVIALMIPTNLKFGVQKSRYLLLVFVVIPVLLGALADAAGFEMPDMVYFGGSTAEASILVILALVLIVFASFRISVRIMEKKEY